MNVDAKDKTQPDSHEVESGRIKDDTVSKTETRGETRPSAGEVEIETGASGPEHDEIACLAYESWQQRGCPIGTPEEDWFRAEEQIKQTLNETPTPNSGLS